MNQIKHSVQGYLGAFGCFILVVSFFSFQFSRLEQMEWINLNHSVFFDYFFIAITNSAEIILPLSFLAFLYFKKRSLLRPYFFSYLGSTLLVQILKNILFADSPRPILYLKSAAIQWHLIDGLAINEMNSFPSGHTNAAWWMYFWMAYLSPNRFTGFLFGFLAFLVAYSRIYLFQHFPIDTLFGAILGCSGSFLAYYLLVFKKEKHA
jgi:membrane-associated phospholipid phosphatase